MEAIFTCLCLIQLAEPLEDIYWMAVLFTQRLNWLLVLCLNLRIAREPDPTFGYQELVVRKRKKK